MFLSNVLSIMFFTIIFANQNFFELFFIKDLDGFKTQKRDTKVKLIYFANAY